MSETETPRRAFPWRAALFASLGLNILGAGAAIGALASGARLERPALAAPAEPDEAPSALRGPRAFLEAAPPQAREALRRDLGRVWRDTKSLREEARAARLALYDAATTETYDAARMRAAFERVREANQSAIAPYHDSLADNLALLNLEERRAAVDAVLAPIADGESDGAADAGLRQDGARWRDLSLEERRALLRERLRERRDQRAD